MFRSVPYYIKAYDSETRDPSAALRLNGLPPGTRYIGNLTLPPSGIGSVMVDVGYAFHNAMRFDDVLFSTDLGGGALDDGGVDAGYQALIATGAMSKARPPCYADCSPDGGDAKVDVNDLLKIINSWGNCVNVFNCPADVAPFAGDGTVDVNDLLKVINSWGDCPL